jgi:hypothetical protein
MKQILILLILTSFALHLRAQQMISVIDDDTHDPIGNALFILDGDTIAYTSPQGIAMVPKRSGIVTVTAYDYRSMIFIADSIPPVIRLKSEIKKLDEVFVFGKMGLRDKFTDKSGYDRIQGKYAGAGGDLGAIFRIFGYRPASERRRERVKKNLEAFDKAEPAPQPNDK